MKKVFVITGEYSGDIHAGRVVEILKEKNPSYELFEESNIKILDYKNKLMDQESLKILNSINIKKWGSVIFGLTWSIIGGIIISFTLVSLFYSFAYTPKVVKKED